MKTPPLIPWWLVVATVAAIMLSVSLSGCSTVPAEIVAHEERHCDGWSHAGGAWVHTRAASAKPWAYIRVPDTNATCRFLGVVEDAPVTGCALWQSVGCIIVLPEGV